MAGLGTGGSAAGRLGAGHRGPTEQCPQPPGSAGGVQVQVRAAGVRPRALPGRRPRLWDQGWMRPVQAGLGQEGQEGPRGRGRSARRFSLWGPRRGPWASGRWAAHLGGEHQGLGGARQCEARAHPVQSDVRLVVAPGCRRAGAPGHGGCGLVAPGCGGHLCVHMSGVSTWAPGRAGRWPWALGVLLSR